MSLAAPAQPHAGATVVASHDDAQRQPLRMRVCLGAREALRSFAASRGVTEAALVDALVHAVASADSIWLEDVVGNARRTDAQRRRRDGGAGAGVLSRA